MKYEWSSMDNNWKLTSIYFDSVIGSECLLNCLGKTKAKLEIFKVRPAKI